MKVANIAEEIHNPHGHRQTVKSGALVIRFAKTLNLNKKGPSQPQIIGYIQSFLVNILFNVQ